MSQTKYAIGVDFGTESGRAVLVEVASGAEVATAVYPYQNGVIDEKLPIPGAHIILDPDWALQDPQDYLRTFQNAVRQVLQKSGVDPADVIGVGIDFTACTMLPVKADGTPLCNLPSTGSIRAWVKLWTTAAQPEADKINATAATCIKPGSTATAARFRRMVLLQDLQIIDEAPHIYAAADRLIEAADWVVWQLTGVEKRNSCTAGYKAIWSKREGFPPAEYFAALDPRLEHVIDEKMSGHLLHWRRAGGLTTQAAGWTGLKTGTACRIAARRPRLRPGRHRHPASAW
jgi:L-ribulokinase